MAKRSNAASQRTESPADELKAYRYGEEELEEALASGKDARLLEDYFGEAAYQRLRALAAEASEKRVRGGPRVLILPGIMGSKIGKRRPILDDVIWFDPIDIAEGHLAEMALGGQHKKLTSLDVIHLAYLDLKFTLWRKGYDASFHHYDWRQSLDVLGKSLVEKLAKEGASEIHLVAHSMGGLVARSALAQDAPKAKQLIMLGTPNYGSFAPVQAIRGVYSVVKGVAALDRKHTAEELSEQVFSTFPGLYQMLPSRDKFSGVDLYDSAGWPQSGPRPRQSILDGAPPVQKMLAAADERFCLIAGVNQETVTGLKVEHGKFVYCTSRDGDGTVPLDFARMDDIRTYYVEESHGSLPNNGKVARAVCDILATGETTRLANHWTPSTRAVRPLTEAELAEPPFDGREGGELTRAEIRSVIRDVVSPTSSEEGAAPSPVRPSGAPGEPGYDLEFDRVVVGRSRQHRIDLRLAYGSITEVDSRAYVLGIFRDVEPTGPALVLDERLDGAIAEFTARRMFTGNVGEVFMMPTGRHPLPADFILFSGLGHFDRFNADVQQLVAENVIRTCIRTKVEEFSTVLFGGGSGQAIAGSLRNLLTGFFRGLLDADDAHWFRGVTICEYDRRRFDLIKQELLRLSSTPLFDDIEVTLDEVTLPAPLIPAVPGRGVIRGEQPVYLIVRQESDHSSGPQYRASVLTAGRKATVISEAKEVRQADLDAHIRKIRTSGFTFARLDKYGERLAELVLPSRIASVLPEMRDNPLVIVHDAAASVIPWETMRVGGWSPAADAGLSRRYVADNLSVAKWLSERQQGAELDLLLVVNPTLDLSGAEEEGERIRTLFGGHPSVKIDELNGREATRETLLSKFRSGKYDVLHYAGHAFFHKPDPSRSGILCHGHQVLSGADLAGIGNLPSLVFFNACEAGRIRGGSASAKPRLNIQKRIQENVGLAEAFLRGGVANYIGTYWPVGDASAKSFAETFYGALLEGESIGQALSTARTRVREQVKSVDWADYIHYGPQDFVLKYRHGAGT